MKQLSIGFASQAGKTNIHTGGITSNWPDMEANWTSQDYFTHSMGDAASTIVNYFRDKKGIAFINVLANISLYCDCSGPSAPEPRIKDIGILASTDPVAIDKASIDLLKAYTDAGTPQLLEQIKFLKGENTIKIAQEHELGSTDYYLVDVDEHDEPNNDEPDKTDEKSEDSFKSERGSLLAVIVSLSCISILLIIVVVVLCFKMHKSDITIENEGLVTKEEEEA